MRSIGSRINISLALVSSFFSSDLFFSISFILSKASSNCLWFYSSVLGVSPKILFLSARNSDFLDLISSGVKRGFPSFMRRMSSRLAYYMALNSSIILGSFKSILDPYAIFLRFSVGLSKSIFITKIKCYCANLIS
jgi:hypothetical protein